jgi:hypothetical protein
MVGMPVLLEKRMRIGVWGAEKWGAVLRVLARGVGTKVPERRMPLA